MNPPFPNTYWLESGRILCGQYPREKSDYGEHELMSVLLEAGVRVFVDLTEEGELKSYREIALGKAAVLGINLEDLEFHRFAIQDVSIPRSPTVMMNILQTIRRARESHRIPYIHCWGGVGRTGTVAGCLLRELFGMDGEQALGELIAKWKCCTKSKNKPFSPETEQQRDYVIAWVPRREETRDSERTASAEEESENPLSNLFQGIGERMSEEQVDLLVKGDGGIRIERIVSEGHASPKDFWYDQDQNEWVTLLSGSAVLTVEDPKFGTTKVFQMKPGDWMLIPAKTRHRVESTILGEKSIWLAVHWEENSLA